MSTVNPKLFDYILKRSEAKTFERAVREWEFHGIQVLKESTRKTCVCGEPIERVSSLISIESLSYTKTYLCAQCAVHFTDFSPENIGHEVQSVHMNEQEWLGHHALAYARNQDWITERQLYAYMVIYKKNLHTLDDDQLGIQRTVNLNVLRHAYGYTAESKYAWMKHQHDRELAGYKDTIVGCATDNGDGNPKGFWQYPVASSGRPWKFTQTADGAEVILKGNKDIVLRRYNANVKSSTA